MQFNEKEQKELNEALTATMSGAASKSNLAVRNYLENSRAFTEGRIEPLRGDVIPMKEINDRVNGLPGVGEKLNGATVDWYRSVSSYNRVINGDELQEKVISACMLPLRSLTIGAKIMEAVVGKSSKLGEMSILAKAITDATGDIGMLSRFGGNRGQAEGLRPYLLGISPDTQEDMSTILGPYLNALKLCVISDNLYRASSSYRKTSENLLRRAVNMANSLNPEKVRDSQGQLNEAILRIDAEKRRIQQGVENSTEGIINVGVNRQDPNIVGGRIAMAKEEGKSSKALEELLDTRNKKAKYVREQSLRAAQVLTAKSSSIIMDDSSQMAANLAGATAMMGELAIVNIIANQAAAGSAALRVGLEYLINGSLKSSDQLENEIEARFSNMRALLLTDIAGRMPEAHLPQNITK